MATDFNITDAELPRDVTPETTADESKVDSNKWYDPQYPYSTPEAPYGFFDKPNGEPDFNRPRKRRPYGSRGGGGSTGKMPASNKQAENAAALLTKLNTILGLGLMSFGMGNTAAELAEANSRFESMAKEALAADPALCRKILTVGATSGKTGLIIAYAVMGSSVAPAAVRELKDKRAEREIEGYEHE